MRRTLALVSAAVTSMVAIAFLALVIHASQAAHPGGAG